MEAMLLMVRHGERCDNSELEEERLRVTNREDPPLTKLGVAQAHVAGKHLKEYLR